MVQRFSRRAGSSVVVGVVVVSVVVDVVVENVVAEVGVVNDSFGFVFFVDGGSGSC